jgi:Holliday junction resolvase RusA-like endonuclease
MTFQVTFTVYGDPQGKARPRFTRSGRAYTPSGTAAYESEIAHMAKAAMGATEPLETPVSVFCYITQGIPASTPKKRLQAFLDGSERPTKKPDLDNVAKAFLDAMNGIVYLDDKQVVTLHCTKVYGTVPSVNILVKEELP